MLLSWALFPLVLAALGLGWGSLVEWACGARAATALTIPLGLAAVICVAAMLTAFSPTAVAAGPVAAAGGLAGLAAPGGARGSLRRRWSRRSGSC